MNEQQQQQQKKSDLFSSRSSGAWAVILLTAFLFGIFPFSASFPFPPFS